MKKLLFLLFGAIFALAGCADDSEQDYSTKCPISSADFTFQRPNPPYKTVKLILLYEDKRQYSRGVKWIDESGREYNKIEPEIFYNINDTQYEGASLYYNGVKCGPELIFAEPVKKSL